MTKESERRIEMAFKASMTLLGIFATVFIGIAGWWIQNVDAKIDAALNHVSGQQEINLRVRSDIQNLYSNDRDIAADMKDIIKQLPKRQ